MQKPPHNFTPLNSLLKNELLKLAGGKLKNTASIETSWRQIVGDTVAQNAKVLFIKSGILHVGVATSTWLQELGFLRAEILQGLKDQLPEVPVADIRFKIVTTPDA